MSAPLELERLFKDGAQLALDVENGVERRGAAGVGRGQKVRLGGFPKGRARLGDGDALGGQLAGEQLEAGAVFLEVVAEILVHCLPIDGALRLGIAV